MCFKYFIKPVILATVIFLTLLSCSSHRDKKVLVFFQQEGKRLPAGIQVIQNMGEKQGFSVDTTSRPATFTEYKLKDYSAVIFLDTPGELLNVHQQTDFERYIQAGGGYVGVTPAIYVKYNWPWYESLIGPMPGTKVPNPEYQETPAQLTAAKEDGAEATEGITSEHRHYDGGNIFVITGNKVSEALASAREQELIAEGIQYAIGENHIDYDLARSLKVPEENRFIKHTLVPGPLDEPTELTVLPDGKVLFTERKGAVKMYYPDEEKVKTIGQLDVHTKFEDGLLGASKDPGFYYNHWIYLYYSPAGDEPVQHLSRFLLLNDSLIMSSEKVILKVPVQREECCHTGGSIAFGPDGNLFLSTGDDTNPFQSDGYAPIDERPGRAPFDAQGSSANSNDLRGKVLRISVNDDATYSIPDGNLFPKDGSQGHPEVYVMGTRNSYRISVDQKTGWLYWGDVGNDARTDGERGPKGYDEINQAKEAGNFGWPHFRGNRAYREYDFATGELGDYFDFDAPANHSPNNTGPKVLPPFKKSLIWYPYDESPEFPILGTGGRTAMAGPVFHYDMYPHAEKRFSKYYDGKLFIYEWMRNWIIAVTMDKDGNLLRLEPFMESFTFNKISDMEMGPDGSIYILEYGDDWFAANANASLSRIEYAEGNRAPIANISADQAVGAAPFTVKFSSEGTFDYDEEDKISYEWFFTGDTQAPQSTDSNPEFTFEDPGIYQVKMIAYDQEGGSDVEEMTIQVGNEKPEIDIALASNATFYWKNQPIDYHITVTDKEDGTTANGSINPAAVNFSFDYIAIAGERVQGEESGHKPSVNGLSLIEDKGCKACHSMEKASVGPAYHEVAAKYERSEETVNRLVSKILKGGGGVWGDRAMPAQAVTQEEAEIVVNYILSLNEEGETLPLRGSFIADKADDDGTYVFEVRYADKGGAVIGPLTAEEVVILRNPKIQVENNDFEHNAKQQTTSDDAYLSELKEGSYFQVNDIDLKNIDALTFRTSAKGNGLQMQVRLDDVKGKVIASTVIPDTKGKTNWQEIKVRLENAPAEKHNLFFVVTETANADKDAEASVDWIYFHGSLGNGVAMQ